MEGAIFYSNAEIGLKSAKSVVVSTYCMPMSIFSILHFARPLPQATLLLRISLKRRRNNFLLDSGTGLPRYCNQQLITVKSTKQDLTLYELNRIHVTVP